MSVISLSATAGPDGVLHLDIPVGAAGEYDIVVRPKTATNGDDRKPTPEELGWPPGFFERIVGSINDPTFVRGDQGWYEEREPLA
ncbi:hypothetical protein [Fimbriiglobus ruber]|uniref:Uncharacterized protein n=1 Tax=Fimbriiglobus ruber TaxID=1908690 RepID=A0A225D6A7_9BACT|nr:hypothetical protein [Fimbriiglobus ruber]OWK36513.1 hypothetical protein FRUB_09076 [Fimbriiglobus ruber]